MDIKHWTASKEDVAEFSDLYFAAHAAEAYATHGRGLLLIVIAADGSQADATYYPLAEIDDDLLSVTDATREAVRSYDPATQAVLLYLQRGGPGLMKVVSVERPH